MLLACLSHLITRFAPFIPLPPPSPSLPHHNHYFSIVVSRTDWSMVPLDTSFSFLPLQSLQLKRSCLPSGCIQGREISSPFHALSFLHKQPQWKTRGHSKLNNPKKVERRKDEGMWWKGEEEKGQGWESRKSKGQPTRQIHISKRYVNKTGKRDKHDRLNANCDRNH